MRSHSLKGFFIVLLIIIFSGCTELRQKIPTIKPENKLSGSKILLNSFSFIYEEWTPGNSGHIFTKIIVFDLNGKNIALINREGIKNRNMIQEVPGEKIKEGGYISYGDGEYGVELENLIESECSLEYGDGKFCELFMSGKCLLLCNSHQTIEILNLDKLNECIGFQGNEVISDILEEGMTIHDLNFDSPCSFYNGEFLRFE